MSNEAVPYVIGGLLLASGCAWTVCAIAELARRPTRRCCRRKWCGGVFAPCPCADRGPRLPPSFQGQRSGLESLHYAASAWEKAWQKVVLPADLWQGNGRLIKDEQRSALALCIYRCLVLIYVGGVWFTGLATNFRFCPDGAAPLPPPPPAALTHRRTRMQGTAAARYRTIWSRSRCRTTPG